MKKFKKLIYIIPIIIFLGLLILFDIPKKTYIQVAKQFQNPEEYKDWELSTVFYDSTVNDGKTALTEINWDASDGGYQEGIPRNIIVQINYKNTSINKTYQPGELLIAINDLLIDDKYAGLNKTVNISANDSTHTGYVWDLKEKVILDISLQMQK